MKIKKNWLKLFFGIFSVSCLLFLLSCQPIKTANTKDELHSIEIVNSCLDKNLFSNEIYLSEPIKIKCFDVNNNEIESKTKLVISAKDEPLPFWIKLQEDKKIKIEKNKAPGSYKFLLQASNLDQTVRSKPKNFIINVLQPNKEPPSEVKIKTCAEQKIYWPDQGNIDLSVDQDNPKYDYSCIWKINQINSINLPLKDLNNQPLFYIDNKEKPILKISKNIDQTYLGDYDLDLQVFITKNNKITDKKLLKIHLYDGLNYYDQETKQTYTRENLTDDWSLSKIFKPYITETKKEIYNYPVTTINQDLAQVSNATEKYGVFSVGHNITKVKQRAFYNCKKLEILKMAKVKVVEKQAFYNCCRAVFSSNDDKPSFNYVGDQAFYNCRDLDLSGYQDFYEIGYQAFYKAESLVSLDIGKNIKLIADQAFGECKNLQTVYLHSSLPPIITGDIFYRCDQLTSIYVPSASLVKYLTDPQWSTYHNKLKTY